MAPIKRESFGKTQDGKDVEKFILSDGSMEVELISYGATIHAIRTKDSKGNLKDVTLGFDDIEGYQGLKGKNPYFGCVVGRVANRICKGVYKIGDKQYKAPQNNGSNSLHGGLKTLDKLVWYPEILSDNSVSFGVHSPDGDNGYPGHMIVNVKYSLISSNEGSGLSLEYTAVADQTTPVNLTNHVYFNLKGQDAGPGSVTEHTVKLNADRFTPVNDELIPTGEIVSVKGTPYDLTEATLLKDSFAQLEKGFDTNFCVNRYNKQHHPSSEDLKLIAEVSHENGRKLKTFTDQPGVQLYTGFFIPEGLVGKNGAVYGKFGAFCLETQNFPDAINQPNFPESLIKPGQVYKHRTIFEFSN